MECILQNYIFCHLCDDHLLRDHAVDRLRLSCNCGRLVRNSEAIQFVLVDPTSEHPPPPILGLT